MGPAKIAQKCRPGDSPLVRPLPGTRLGPMGVIRRVPAPCQTSLGTPGEKAAADDGVAAPTGPSWPRIVGCREHGEAPLQGWDARSRKISLGGGTL